MQVSQFVPRQRHLCDWATVMPTVWDRQNGMPTDSGFVQFEFNTVYFLAQQHGAPRCIRAPPLPPGLDLAHAGLSADLAVFGGRAC